MSKPKCHVRAQWCAVSMLKQLFCDVIHVCTVYMKRPTHDKSQIPNMHYATEDITHELYLGVNTVEPS